MTDRRSSAPSSIDRQLCRQVARWLAEGGVAAAFTGAGVSTESGIPDFRSPGGVWATSRPVYYQEFLDSAQARQEYWRQKAITHRQFTSSKPNRGHLVLARWQDDDRLSAVITQNIDGLHQQAGSRSVIELHGTALKVDCLSCRASFDAEEMVAAFEAAGRPPDCPECGGLLKHATISFGQSLEESVLARAAEIASAAELFLAIGSSLVVEPAASLPWLAKSRGARLVIINRDPTPLDDFADALLRSPIGDTLSTIDELLGEPAG